MTAPRHNHGSGHHRRRSGPTTATAAVVATSGSSSTRIPHVTGRTPHSIIHVTRTALATRREPHTTHHAPRTTHRAPRTTHHALLRYATRFITWARALHDSRLPAYGYVCVLSQAGKRARVRVYGRHDLDPPTEVSAAAARVPPARRARVWAYF